MILRGTCIALFALLASVAGPAVAGAPDTSPRPAARTADTVTAEQPAIRPPPRPDIVVARAAPLDATEVVTTSGVLRSPRPEARGTPPARTQSASPPAQAAQPERVQPVSTGVRTNPLLQALRGRPKGLCGTDDIEGVRLQKITGRLRGCVIENPVRVSRVAGIGLTQDAVMDCDTALALRQWVTGAAVPTTANRGGGLKSLRVAAHYACRTRNNRKGAKLSEHGKGRAIDISGLVLANGEVITVLRGWRTRDDGRILKSLHRAACGPFGTVLGPNSDRFHQDHFHFDTARYRSGPFCR